jgi:hypothetical protein
VRKYHLDHGVVSFAGLSIHAVLWDFVGVKRQITIRRLLAVFMIAGLVLAPLSRPVMAGMASDAMASDASMPAMAEDMSMAVSADMMANDMTASDMPCCPSKAPSPLECDKCIFMAACATKCFSGLSAAVFHPVLAVSVRIVPLRNESWPDSLGYPPPDHPPRTLI